MTRLLRTTGGVLLIVVLLGAAAVLGYVETHAARSPAASQHSAAPTGAGASALAAAGAQPSATVPPGGSPASAAAVARTVRPALAARALGSRVHGEVIDVGTGRVLLADGARVPGAPASTAKLLTATAVLATRGPGYRISTRLEYVAGSAAGGGTLVLIGGGDPTLTAATGSVAAAYPDAARLSTLVRAVRAKHLTVAKIVVDDAAFSGPTTSPAWDADDVPSSYGAGITAVMTDGGRAAPGDVIRSAAPDLAAGHELAVQLGSPTLPIVRGTVPGGARTVATVRSAPMSTLIEQMLQESDNVIADCLARQVAMAEHDPVTFTGAARAIRTVIGTLGMHVGAGMVDGSGLAASDRLTVAGLAGVLGVIAHDAGTGTDGALGAVVAGLPVAAWSGTLNDRFVSGSARGGAGVVRAKTGTLTGVSALAGLVHDRSGRLLAFAFLADRTGPTPQAEAALDVAATRLASCGCS